MEKQVIQERVKGSVRNLPSPPQARQSQDDGHQKDIQPNKTDKITSNKKIAVRTDTKTGNKRGKSTLFLTMKCHGGFVYHIRLLASMCAYTKHSTSFTFLTTNEQAVQPTSIKSPSPTRLPFLPSPTVRHSPLFLMYR